MTPEALLILLIVPFAVLATVLGWMAVAQIRRSGGKRCGLWLAVADGLLFPLMGLFAFIAWLTRQFSVVILGWPLNDPVKNTIGIFATLAIFGAAGALVVWLVWRAVNQSPAPASPSTTRRVALGCGVLLILVLTPVAMVALLFSWNQARQVRYEEAMRAEVREKEEEEAKARAQVEAAQAKAIAATARFGPVQEGLADRSGRGGFDLDTGRFIAFDPRMVGTAPYDVAALPRAHRWLQAQGIDVFGDPDSARPGLLFTAVDPAVREVDAGLWDADPKDLITMLPPPPPTGVYTDHQTFIDAPQGTGHPKTRLIRTQQGGAAILQILEVTDRREVKFRYKPILTGPR